MRDTFPSGPVNQEKELVGYGFEQESNDKLAVYRYSYPGGASEEFRDYGGYFGVYWTANPSVSHDDLMVTLSKIPQISNSPNKFEMRCITKDSMSTVELDYIDEISEAFDLIKNENSHSYSLEAGIGTFFWEVDPEGKIAVIGTLTYNGAPIDSILDWQRRTAHPEISQRGNGAIASNLPAELDDTTE